MSSSWGHYLEEEITMLIREYLTCYTDIDFANKPIDSLSLVNLSKSFKVFHTYECMQL